MGIDVVLHENLAHSIGAAGSLADCEIAILFEAAANAGAAAQLCEHLVTYFADSGQKIKDGDRVAWATTILEFGGDNDMLVGRSVDPSRNVVEPSADRTLIAWRAQVEVCASNDSEYQPPRLEDKVVASPDLLEGGGEVVEGVRYPFAAPNCGWWLFGSGFNGNIDGMRRIDLGDVVALNPSVVRYLSLEPGFCFSPSTARVWFEAEAAAREPL